MITKILINDEGVFDCRGLDAEKDEVKNNCANGSTYFAMDTGNVYMLKVTEDPVTKVITAEWLPL